MDEYRHDRVLRAYSHTAWTSADPLAGLEPHVRQAILMMPSTFRERMKVAPWTNRLQRRMAIVEILSERRLSYELSTQTVTAQARDRGIQPPAPPPCQSFS